MLEPTGVGGTTCAPLLSVRYEDLLPLPLEEARERLRFIPAPPLR